MGVMLNGWHDGERTGSGTIVWKARELLAAGRIDSREFVALVASSAPSTGHCNTMGTASTMNSLAEALGMMLPGMVAQAMQAGQQPGQQGQQGPGLTGPVCNKCKTQLAPDAQFCTNCGAQIQTWLVCPKCTAQVPPDAKFCGKCGTPTTQSCTKCGVALPVDAKFCLKCGQEVKA